MHEGTVEVHYLEEKPESNHGPFLKEERSLLNAIAELLGLIIERKQAEEGLQRTHDELELQVATRTAELARADEEFLAEIIERKPGGGCITREFRKTENLCFLYCARSQEPGYKHPRTDRASS